MSGQFIQRFRKCQSGTALIEFAVVLPVLLLMYLGGFQLSDAISCNRKVTIATRAIADLTSQYATLSDTVTDAILAASTQVMAPYDASNATLRVSEITISSKGGNVDWSRARNGAPLPKGSTVSVPAEFTLASGYKLIVAEVTYTYVPALGTAFMPTKTLSQTIYMLPRISNDIPCDTCQS